MEVSTQTTAHLTLATHGFSRGWEIWLLFWAAMGPADSQSFCIKKNGYQGSTQCLPQLGFKPNQNGFRVLGLSHPDVLLLLHFSKERVRVSHSPPQILSLISGCLFPDFSVLLLLTDGTCNTLQRSAFRLPEPLSPCLGIGMALRQ